MAFIDGEYIGLNGQKIAAIYDTVTGQFHQKQVLYDPSGNPIASTAGNNGRGLNVVVLNDVPAVGLDADDAVMQSANYPVYIGGRVRLGTAALPLAADGDARGLGLTGDGRVVAAPIGFPEDQGTTAPIEGATDQNRHALIGAQASPVKIALWGVELVNHSAGVAGITLHDGDTAGVIGRAACPASSGRTASWGGAVRTSAATALYYAMTANVTAGQFYIMPIWYKVRA